MKSNADHGAGGRGRRRDMTRMRRAGVLAILAAAAAVVLAGCSGGGSSAPPVASLGASSAPATSASSGTSADPGPGSGISGANGANGGGGTRATIAGNVTPLLNEWGACERGNGDPQQTDPTVDAGGVIHITIPKGAQPAGDLHEQSGTCSQYLAEAQNELRAANPVAPPPDEAEYLKYVNCMRTNGVPDYPYPTGDSTDFYGTGVDPNSPAVERVNQLCGTKLGLPAWWVNGTDIPGSIEVHTAGMPANPTPQACFYRKVDPCPGPVTAPGNGGSGGNG
jgi:hypothetical protein